MPCRTQQNTITRIVGTTPIPILGSSPHRKSFLCSPIAGGSGAGLAVAAVVFAPGTNQQWPVPAGVTEIIDCYVWGSGGNSGSPGMVLGGGGGGGGGFSNSGPQAVTPGSIFTVNVDGGGDASTSSVINPSGTTISLAHSGANGLADAAGAGGAAGTGVQTLAGGAGAAATGLAGPGGGGGGGGGSFSAGSAAINSFGGAGGGAATIDGFGVGGAGGAGGATGAAGTVGAAPGGGGGGSGNTGHGQQVGGAGQVVILYTPPVSAQAISMSHRSDVVPGVGILNYLPGATFPTLISDDDIGNIIQDEWYIVSGVPGVSVQITEYLYERDA
jgi:hypothetical protein